MNDKTSLVERGDRPKWLTSLIAILSFYFGFMVINIMLFGVASVIREKYGIDDSNIWALLLACLFLLVAAVVGTMFTRWQHRILATKSVILSYVALGILVVLCVLCTPLPMPSVYVIE